MLTLKRGMQEQRLREPHHELSPRDPIVESLHCFNCAVSTDV